ncbi:MAG: response regulator [Candidatus Omnitrophica bacterium]|nr:response regulator [Candidatus Omnitrophota bacterium]
MPKKILMVDDEEEILESMYAVLETQGYALVSANDGTEALEKAKEEKPDLIISDVVLPKMTGYDVIKELQALGGELSQIPVIIMSGKPSMKEAFHLFADPKRHYFLSKPFLLDDLIAMVEKLIGKA